MQTTQKLFFFKPQFKAFSSYFVYFVAVICQLGCGDDVLLTASVVQSASWHFSLLSDSPFYLERAISLIQT
jgi:hypothetical protein